MNRITKHERIDKSRFRVTVEAASMEAGRRYLQRFYGEAFDVRLLYKVRDTESRWAFMVCPAGAATVEPMKRPRVQALTVVIAGLMYKGGAR